jgi:hypothetical protein
MTDCDLKYFTLGSFFICIRIHTYYRTPRRIYQNAQVCNVITYYFGVSVLRQGLDLVNLLP